MINEVKLRRLPNRKPGQTYAIPCGLGQVFLAQVGSDSAGSLTMFRETMDTLDEIEIIRRAPDYLATATALRRLDVATGGHKYLNWINAGMHPLHPEAQKEFWKLMNSNGADRGEASLYSDSLPYGRSVRWADYEDSDIEVGIHAPTYLFWNWLTNTRPHHDSEVGRARALEAIKAVRSDPEKRARANEIMPGYIEKLEEIHGLV